MLQQIKNSFEKHSAKIAFCIRNQSYSYADLLLYVNGIRNLLQKERPQSHFIGLAGFDDLETYAAILALWAEGYAFVPLSPNSPVERNESVLRQANVSYVLSSRASTDSLMTTAKVILTKEAKGTNQSFSDLSDWKVDEIMCMIFTSGSTGIPKGVPYTFKNINTTLDAFFALGYDLSEKDRFLQMFEFTFDMSLLSYLPAWCIGAAVYPINHKQVKYLAAYQVLQQQAITFAAMVPSTLQFLKPYFAQANLPDLRFCLLGGEPFYTDLAAAWIPCIPNARVINISGPCETTMACIGYELSRKMSENKSHQNILAFGKPWKNTKAMLVNEQLEEVSVGEEGELCFAGDNLMQGYWKLPEKNADLFFDKTIDGQSYRFYKSGDMAFADESGILYSCGRKDQQYKIQGYKVELGDVERHARDFLVIKNVATTVIKNEKGILEIHLFVEGQIENEDELLSFLKQQLPVYMLPKNIHQLDHLPLTQSGKLDRKQLKDLVR